jgi:nucleoside-diphosphate-sugar epimerase
MKTILVIGASGFIGGNLTKQLLAEGYEVRCLAR